MSFLSAKKRIIEDTDPDRVYTENIRSFFNVNSRIARKLCDAAVKRGFFDKYIELRCPNDNSTIVSAERFEDIPDTIVCQNCQLNEADKYEFKKEDLSPNTFYKLSSTYRTEKASI
ncbi:hypothetical protein [uncultured Psychroserpens sp.]|uniref:hypothetical protein n=1 Tax=uncultured Psychroserpens sp. TaxID=255436 RepID=UPI0026045F16|nr:hypothetical protein [uncultured Psychroserpens sp.]